MSASRLTTAVQQGAVALPADGRIAVFRPRADFDLSTLPPDRVHVIQGFRRDYDAFAAQGYRVGTVPEGRFDAALICVPRAKAETRALVAQAADVTDGPIIVDGQKTDGIESLLREIRSRADVGEVTSKSHGKLFAFTGGEFADWKAQEATIECGFVTAPGVFSADGIDAGSAALAAALPVQMPKRVADLGAGWGYLSRAILERAGVEELHLIEAEHAALECARRNVTDPRARFHWADATRFSLDPPVDAVVCNPPFHTGRAADPALGRAFIAASARLLKPSGKLWLVANRHLPYEAEAARHFSDVQETGGPAAFKILACAKPRRTRR